MSKFIAMARELSAMTEPSRFSTDDLARIGAGRLIAKELLVALSNGERDPDLLASLTVLAGRAHQNTLRGYFRELQDSLARVALA